MSATDRPSWREKNRVLVAVYPDEEKARTVVKHLIDSRHIIDSRHTRRKDSRLA
jgi:hypothetical protein